VESLCRDSCVINTPWLVFELIRTNQLRTSEPNVTSFQRVHPQLQTFEVSHALICKSNKIANSS